MFGIAVPQTGGEDPGSGRTVAAEPRSARTARTVRGRKGRDWGKDRARAPS